MTAQLIDGNATAKAMRESIKERVDARLEQGKRAPGLAVILVGTDPASQVYVSHKRKDCEQVGINSKAFDLPATTSQQELLDLIDQLNNDNDVDGILVQLPLPKHIEEQAIVGAIAVEKDADGFSAYNIGNLAMKGGDPMALACTPAGHE